jgi:hypothetical protein
MSVMMGSVAHHQGRKYGSGDLEHIGEESLGQESHQEDVA